MPAASVNGMIFISFWTVNNNIASKPLKPKHIMANTGKTVATLLIGAAVGAAVGYILATDKEKRSAHVDAIKDKISDVKNRFAKKGEDLEQEIYNG